MAAWVVLSLSLVPAPAAAQVVADTFTRTDSTDLGTSEVGARTYREYAAPGAGPFVDDIAQIAGNRLRFHGGVSLTDPAVVTVTAVAFDVELRARIRFLDDNYAVGDRANNVYVSLRSTIGAGAAPVVTPGVVHLNLSPDGSFGVRAWHGSPITFTTVASGTVGAALASADLDGDGILESNEPFQVVLAVTGDQVRFRFNGTEVSSNALPTEAMTGVDPGTARSLWFGRNRSVGTAQELQVEWDDLEIYDGQAAPIDAGVDAPIDAAADAATDAATDPAAVVDAGPANDAARADAASGVDGDDGGGCCGASPTPSPSIVLLAAAVAIAISRRRRGA